MKLPIIACLALVILTLGGCAGTAGLSHGQNWRGPTHTPSGGLVPGQNPY